MITLKNTIDHHNKELNKNNNNNGASTPLKVYARVAESFNSNIYENIPITAQSS